LQELALSDLIAAHTASSGQRLQLVHGDITEEAVDAIVNAANAVLLHGGGVAAAIVRRGGQEIQTESDAWVKEHGPISHHRPAITGSGKMPCRFVIHAVGPVWGEGDEDQKLQVAVGSALDLASDRHLTSLALPAISTGIFGFPKDRGARVILDAILDFFNRQPEASVREVHVTLIDELSVGIFRDEFSRRWPESVIIE
jgi:O-acetyl-ADP-ribose deacetylase (regulator of RNase III)